MRVLLLGGTGFVGAAVTRHLRVLGHAVTVFHRRPCAAPDHLHGDRHQLEAYAAPFAAVAPEVVIDAIAASAAAVRSTLRVFGGPNRRIVLLSSQDVYRAWGLFHGTESGGLEPAPLTESSPLRAQAALYPPAIQADLRQRYPWLDAAGYDKLGMERAAAAWLTRAGSPPLTILRLPWLYGPGDPQHRLWPLYRRIRDGRSAILLPRAWAEWRSARGYIENIAAAIALAATHPKARGRVYNLADAETLTEAEWAQHVALAANWRGRIVVTAPAHTPPHLRVVANTAQSLAADASRLRQDLGFRDPVPLAQALAASLAFEREHPPLDRPLTREYAAEDAALRSLGLTPASLRTQQTAA